MSVTIGIIGAAFSALCIWLTVRIISRREKWSKWTLAAALILPLIYLGSFGPVTKHAHSLWARDWEVDFADNLYGPIYDACKMTGTLPLLWQYLNFCGCDFEPAATGCVLE